MRVLLVEDDDDIAAIVAETLADSGHAVDRAADGPDGLWMAREGNHALIVLDLLLPGLNGYQVCETLRSEGRHVPILMLTAKVGEYDETDGFDAGADDYLRKPFSPAVLQARVQALLRRAPNPRREAVLERGRVRLDPTSRTCSLDGRPVELTSREAQLLEALLRSDDAPLGRLALLDEVWGHDFDGDPNVVDVYVRYLRGKVGRETIENVRGVGYRVRA
ncbi:MAG: response regulator transcription factor [Actinomycetota bacterium]